MILSTLRRWLLLAVIGLVTMAVAKAEPVKVVRVGDTLIAMQGNLVASTYNEVTGEGSQYFYISGLLWQAAYSDGTVSGYFYDADGKLLRIETQKYARDREGKLHPTSAAGTTQHAVYAGKKLIALASSTGGRLVMDASLAQRGDVVMKVRAPKGRQVTLSAPTATDQRNSFNHRLMAIHGWETRPANWECTKTPEGEDICIGRGPGDGGGGPAPPYEPGPQPDVPPPGHGGGDEGIGGGGGEGGDDTHYQTVSTPIPPNLPTQRSCLQAAHNTYMIMLDQVCKYVKDRMICEAHAFVLWEEQVRFCAGKYPD